MLWGVVGLPMFGVPAFAFAAAARGVARSARAAAGLLGVVGLAASAVGWRLAFTGKTPW